MNRAFVIGGGVVGSTIALALQTQGRRVTVIDPQAHPRTASWGNAGHVAVEQIAPSPLGPRSPTHRGACSPATALSPCRCATSGPGGRSRSNSPAPPAGSQRASAR